MQVEVEIAQHLRATQRIDQGPMTLVLPDMSRARQSGRGTGARGERELPRPPREGRAR